MAQPAQPENRADVLLREAAALIAPLARLLVANGVSYPVFAKQLKRIFLESAHAELASRHERITDSALSLLSGVHRKDVRTLQRPQAEPGVAARRPFSFAAEVVAHWISDARYLDDSGAPRPLPIRSADPQAITFESLTQGLSRDFHARSVLNELLRLGAVAVEEDTVRLVSQAFVPSRGFAEMAYFLGTNVADHIAAAAANIAAADRGDRPPFIEYAVGADELTQQSAQDIQQLAKRLVLSAFMRVSNEAERRIEGDRPALGAAKGSRLKFGAYFYIEPCDAAASDPKDRGDSGGKDGE
jgi:hypothetical protein